jgi:hypothetical protein
MKQITQWILFIALLLLVVGCGVLGGNIKTGADQEFRPDGQVYTYCGTVCAAKGQCGEINRDGTTVKVVLVNPSEPATENHGAFIEDNFVVNVLELRRVNVIFQQSGELYENYPYYRVGDTTSPIVGWVDGVCLADKAR